MPRSVATKKSAMQAIEKLTPRQVLYLAIAILSATTLIAFWPTLSAGFTSWDDDWYVTDNWVITSLSWANIKHMFSSYHISGHYHPLVLLSFAFEYALVGLNPWLYHLNNVILHAANAILLWLVFMKLNELLFGKEHGRFRYLLIPAIVALLFALHPSRVESVAWVSERKDVLYTLFFFWSTLYYIKYLQSEQRLHYWLALGLFAVSLLAKSMAMTLPALLFLLDYLVERKFSKKTIIEKVPFATLALAALIIGLSSNIFEIVGRPPAFKLALAGSYRLIFYYIYTIFVPIHPYLGAPLDFNQAFPTLYYVAPVLNLAIIGLAVWAGLKNKRKITFGILFFYITIAPILPSYYPGVAAIRYSYVPAIGIFFLLALFLSNLYEQNFNRSGKRQTFLVICGAVLLALSVQTFFWSQAWQNDLTLFNDVVQKSPLDGRGFGNRAVALAQAGRYDEAIRDCNQALKLLPGRIEFLVNRGSYYQKKGMYHNALADFSTSLARNGNYVPAYLNRANLYGELKNYSAAIADYGRVIQLQPNNHRAHGNLGRLYVLLADYPKALAHLNRAIALRPQVADYHNNRAAIFFYSKDYARARAAYQQAIRIYAGNSLAHFNLGVLAQLENKNDEALQHFSRALAANPRYAEAYFRRGELYLLAGDKARAIADLSLAVKYAPGNVNYASRLTEAKNR